MDYSIILLFNIMIKTDSDFVNFSTNHKYIYFSLIVFLFFSLTSIIYHLIFKILKLNRTVISFICFNLFVLILFLYLRSLYFFLIHYQDMTPIRINNLSLFAQYRYLFYSIMVLVFGVFWCLSFYVKNLKTF